jgi:hypothetical protein
MPDRAAVLENQSESAVIFEVGLAVHDHEWGNANKQLPEPRFEQTNGRVDLGPSSIAMTRRAHDAGTSEKR